KDRLQKVLLLLSDGQEEELRPRTLMYSDQYVLYCRVERNDLLTPVRFMPNEYHELALMMEFKADFAALPMGGRIWLVDEYDKGPLSKDAIFKKPVSEIK
ncbi:hypothetical protein KAI87_17665, partial [Myxococcota bacterium]|nr:hypothetical protein [Myxococcota bacterium]